MNGDVNMGDNSNKDRTAFAPKIKWILWDTITMPFYRVRNFFCNKWWEFRKRCQRFKRGFAWCDVWDMNGWFISTARPMLEHLLKKHCGHPCNIENEEWETTLQEMIDCLELMDEDKAKSYLGIADDNYSAESYKKVCGLMEEKKDRLFELFSKWFFDLWD